MPFLDTIFGRNTPTTQTASAALKRVEAELAAVSARIAAAEAALKDIASMSDTDQAAAIAERDAAHRSAARLEAQVQQLRDALANAEKTEAAAVLAARAKAAGGMLAKMEKVEREIAACNVAIDAARRAGPRLPERWRRPISDIAPSRTLRRRKGGSWRTSFNIGPGEPGPTSV